ncbi:MAG: sigma 54-interacting transcriptional regulator [Kiritimatiellia bacterium]|jgi:Nif-specific regulatory protein|nr:sigma 54-interacting transcriptional regulator [Kiritimatiellia bacterium]
MNPPRHFQELTLLHNVSTLVDQTIDVRAVVHPILEALAACLDFRVSTITLLRKGGDDILIEAAHGLTRAQAQLGRYKLGEGVIGNVVLTGESIIIPRTSESPIFLNRTRQGKSSDTAFLCVPIKEKQEVVGALSVYRPSVGDEQLREDATILEIVASMLARAVLLRRDLQEQQDTLREENRQLRAELTRRYHPDNIVGNSREMQELYDQIYQVAKSQATVLIQGETGTGKELVAHAIHYASPRAAQPFVRVHCAALPENLIESELFGHVKGAYTGALADRKGRFELADGGTIFLDEIGEIPLAIQAKLLRVLQEREFERVGGVKTVKVNVRILAATHRDLPAMVEKGLFREDLYYRLCVFPLFVPPLAKRKADILLLAEYFIAKYAAANGKTVTRLSNEALDLLMRYRWPGNVRELENCIERAVLLTDNDLIRPEVLAAAVQSTGEPEKPEMEAPFMPALLEDVSLEEMVDDYEKRILVAVLAQTHGNIAAAARRLKSTPRIVSYKVKQHGLAPAR